MIVKFVTFHPRGWNGVTKPRSIRTWYIHVTLANKKLKVKWTRYRPGVAQMMGRGIALLFHDRGIRSGWVVSSTPRPHFNPGKDHVPILTGGWVGPRSGVDRRKISSPLGFDPGTSSQ